MSIVQATAALLLVLAVICGVQGDDCNVFSESSDVNAEAKCPMPSNCKEWYKAGIRKDGVYPVNPGDDEAFQVYCDMTTDGGGWTVFQRRLTGTLSFYRKWVDYEEGFGDLKGEFWLGLEKIHRLTPLSKEHSLRIELTTTANLERYANYSSFRVKDGTVNNQYMLQVGGYSGSAGDKLTYHNGMKFSTFDRDNDKKTGSPDNCAASLKGAWWYNRCYDSNLNGYFSKSASTNTMRWKSVSGVIKTTEMKMRENN